MQVNSVQNHLNLPESQCFLCQDTKCCNTFNLFFPWRRIWGELENPSLEYSLPQCGLQHKILPAPSTSSRPLSDKTPYITSHLAHRPLWLILPQSPAPALCGADQAAPAGRKPDTQKNPHKESRARPGD